MLFNKFLGFASYMAFLALIDPRQAAAFECPYQMQTFSQKVNHFGPDEGTFNQRYQLDTSHFKPGGPILFWQNDESELGCLFTRSLPSFANATNGMAVSLEHRFFGKSIPSNATGTKQFQSLTLDNVMQDAVEFIGHLKKKVPGAENSPVIVHGGSYGGFLSAVFRLNHPETFDGSIAYAAPMKSFGPGSQNPSRFNEYEWLSQTYQEKSFEASMKIKSALAHLVSADAYSFDDLTTGLNLCTTPKNHSDLTALSYSIGKTYLENAQYSFSSGPIIRNRFEHVINSTLAAPITNYMNVLNASVSTYITANAQKCFNWAADSGIVLGVGVEVFHYIVCNYDDYSNSRIPGNGTIFAPLAPGKPPLWSDCKAKYGIQPPDMRELQARYKFSPEDVWNSERILFSVGGLDPVTGMAPMELFTKFSPRGRMDTSILMVDHGAHVEDAFVPNPLDKAGVVRAREVQLETIKMWVQELSGLRH